MEIDVTQPITDTPSGVLTLYPGNNTILDLQGHEVDIKRLQLTSVVSNVAVGATLTVVDSVGGGLLNVDNSAATGSAAGFAAIEVDGDAVGSVLNIQGASVTAVSSSAANATGAAIGGGTWNGLSGAAGSISVTDYNGVYSTVTATGSAGGAGIGDGAGAGGAVISVTGHSHVIATAPGSSSVPGYAAAIGGGKDPQTGHTAGPNVTVDDYASVSAISYGSGAAIGGGRYGAGGSVTVQSQAHVIAAGDSTLGQAGIGDGAMSVSGRTTTFSSSGAATVVATGGGAGGAAIGGASTSFGGDNVTIGTGTTVTVAAASGVTAIGAPSGSAAGSISNNGTLIVSSGSTVRVPSNASLSSDGSFVNHGVLSVAGSFSSTGPLTSDGTIAVSGNGSLTNSATLTNTGSTTLSSAATLNNSGTISNTGSISGSGTVVNSGSVIQNGSFTPSSITGNAFNIVYDGQGGSKSASSQLVYADTIAAASQSIATATPPSTGTFTGWNTSADGTGTALTATSSLTAVGGGSAAGSPFRVNVYALYQIAPVLPSSSTLAQAVVGTAYSASVAATAGTSPIGYQKASGDLPAGLSLNSASGAITGTPTTAGTFTMTVQAQNTFSASHQYTIQVVPAPITLAVPTTSKGTSWYLAGSSASLKIGGLQANETYSVSIGGKTVATGKAASNSAFTLKVTVPKSIGDGSQTVRVSGGVHATAATATILTASVAKALKVKLSAKKVKAKKAITITISKLYAGESVRVVIKGKHGKTAVGKATSKGVYVLKLKTGLAKGKYTVTVTGAGTSRKATTKLTVS